MEAGPPGGPPGGGTLGGSNEQMTRVIKLLAERCGIHMSPAADLTTFLNHLETGIATRYNQQDQQATGADTMSQTSQQAPQVAPNPNIMMSLETTTKNLEATNKRLEAAEKRNSMLEQVQINQHKNELKRRIKRAFASSPNLEKKYTEKLDTIQLSLDQQTGALAPNEISMKLDALEEFGLPDDPTDNIQMALGDGTVQVSGGAMAEGGDTIMDEALADDIADTMTKGDYKRSKNYKPVAK
jgi:hypothetical protein